MIGSVKLKSKIFPASACAGRVTSTLVMAANAAGFARLDSSIRLHNPRYPFSPSSDLLSACWTPGLTSALALSWLWTPMHPVPSPSCILAFSVELVEVSTKMNKSPNPYSRLWSSDRKQYVAESRPHASNSHLLISNFRFQRHQASFRRTFLLGFSFPAWNNSMQRKIGIGLTWQFAGRSAWGSSRCVLVPGQPKRFSQPGE